MSETTEQLQGLIRERLSEIEAESRRLKAAVAALARPKRRGRPPGRRRASRG
jgi:hypothetical protein